MIIQVRIKKLYKSVQNNILVTTRYDNVR